MRQFGLAQFDDKQREKYEDISSNILQKQTLELRDQLKIFQDRLTIFANKHNEELRENPEFRLKFTRMCSSIGINPLSLFDKDKHLFTVNDFYYEICVKVIEICRQTKDMNGGVISFDELEKCFKHLRVGRPDLEKAINMLLALDGGFEVFEIRQKKFIRSVPNELTDDQTKILEICSILGYATASLLKANLNWTNVRSKAVIDGMVANGLLWVDKQAGSETYYWDPSWMARIN
ncbi:ESCRT-II subunit protein SNF8 NDAI_0B02190 [Naumovozyma dairenensis CBS 421]|uniref:Vacuolar-sorting protein SNF8 n=1 Tax=Naumovozyma dairenensis (strain ATCC 10597 / BCRC 20456 / CBS 421 / NBRC 0211 / NRRL Y-12639) TaxID=1071378 RepID=G0W643_NAUDC|nr:hypothetical protein NDAI_0B02190 [Naumovozyma dairenensis CBS 421]CCD23254.1 hypothetical protein NDAI_0B02190 [Naumovozyma dairenensis CBS 421]